jgi:DNA-binding LytR/AlgR family response regulator
VPVLVRIIERDRIAIETIRAAVQRDRDLLFGEVVADVRSLAEAEIGIVNVSHLSSSDKERVRLIGAPPGVVLISVSDNRQALETIGTRSAVPVLAPVTANAISEALEQAKTMVLASRFESLSSLLAAYCSADRQARSASGEVPNADEIEWIEADGNYIRIHADGGTHTVRMTMVQAEEKFYDSDIARVHRKWLVNLSRIAEVRSDAAGATSLKMSSGTQFAVGRAYRSAVRQRLATTEVRESWSARQLLSTQ